MDIGQVFQELDALFAQKKLKEAEQFLQEHLKKAAGQEDKGAELTILNELIGYYRSTGRNEKAIEMAERAIALLEEMQLAGTVHAATTLLNAATAYRLAGYRKEALSLFQISAEILRKELPPYDYRLAALYNNMSGLYQDMEQEEEAAQMLESALEIICRTEDSLAEQAVTHTNLSLIYQSLKNYGEAKKHVEQALFLFEGMTGERDIHYGAALSARAQLYLAERDYVRAAEAYQKALTEVKAVYGENQAYAVLCGNYAVVCEAAGRMEEAEKYRRLEEKIREGLGRSIQKERVTEESFGGK